MNAPAGYSPEENLRMRATLANFGDPERTFCRPSPVCRARPTAVASVCRRLRYHNRATFDAQFCADRGETGIPAGGDQPQASSPPSASATPRRYMLTAERFGVRGHRIGLVHEIIAGQAGLDEAVGEMVDALLKNGPKAQAALSADPVLFPVS